jgi:hypothetical protein
MIIGAPIVDNSTGGMTIRDPVDNNPSGTMAIGASTVDNPAGETTMQSKNFNFKEQVTFSIFSLRG